jgi:endonuclease/exonuclease/phosphatase family metal-dependent hydrolase
MDVATSFSRQALLSLLLVVCVALTIVPLTATDTAAQQPQLPSPPGQLYVVSVNTYQGQIIGTERFRAMLELVRTILKRPAAFGGGSKAIGAAPDVIMLQEMRESNFEIFEKLLRQRSSFRYEIAGSTTTNGKFIINTDQVALQGESRSWTDPCYANPSDESRVRTYQWAELTEVGTNAPFAVASVHFDKDYLKETGQEGCLERNIQELRRQLSRVTVPTVIGGDFNRRAVETTFECDPNELSAPLPWWLELTDPEGGTAYNDAVKTWHQSRGLSLENEWTHEQKAASLACDGSTRFRRTRIDYLFTSGMEAASVHADHPGWAGPEPGTRHPTNPRYSDHRFVAGRFQIAGPPRPPAPSAAPSVNGNIQLSWAPLDPPAAGWVIYRTTGSRPYKFLTRLAPESLTFTDTATDHGVTYRYAIAGVDAAGAQGLESPAARARADARGPVVVSRSPGRNGTGIERSRGIVARFNENVDPESVSANTINVYRKGRAICGFTRQRSEQVLAFEPCGPLAKRKDHRVVVYAVRDELGNKGTRATWTFTTR